MTHVSSGMKHSRASAQFFMLMSFATVNNDDPDDRSFKSAWVLEGDWHGTNHFGDQSLCVAWRRIKFFCLMPLSFGGCYPTLSSMSWLIFKYILEESY